jgi:5-methylcytosine-specific restriction protein B
MLTTMNKRITVLYDREHTLGHAFFMSLTNESTIHDLANIFKNKIIPLLQEYFFEDRENRIRLGDDKAKTNNGIY